VTTVAATVARGGSHRAHLSPRPHIQEAQLLRSGTTAAAHEAQPCAAPAVSDGTAEQPGLRVAGADHEPVRRIGRA
jgi:hypothetical protein